MRRAARTDSNHASIRDLMRKLGCIVEDTSDVGRGFPDLVIRTPRGRVVLVEIKDPRQPPSKRKLRPQQEAFRRRWGADYVVVESEEDAIRLATGQTEGRQ